MTDKKYELLSIDENGDERRRYYSDNSIRNQNGQLLVLPDTAIQITKDTANDYNKRRKQKILDEIEKKVQDITKTNLPAEAIAAIVGKRAEIAMNDTTRTGNEAAKLVLQAMDAYQERVIETVQTNRQEYAIDADTMLLLQDMITAKRRTDVLDSTENIVEVEE